MPETTPVSPKAFASEWPTWCPRCGDFGVLSALQKAAAQLGLTPDDVVVVSGIGCSGKINSYFRSYGLHTLHGRSVPVAQGVKLANPQLTVIAAGGDGDGYGIGAGHFMHAVRRNVDMTYLVMDNQVYGLTKGQTSPTSPQGFHSPTTPSGSADNPVHPLRVALANGCTWIGQGFSGDPNKLSALMVQAIQHRGFSLLNVFSPCVTYRATIEENGEKLDVYQWFKNHLYSIDESYNAHDRAAAFSLLLEHNDLVTGVIYEDTTTAPYDSFLPGYTTSPLAELAVPLEENFLAKMEAQFQ